MMSVLPAMPAIPRDSTAVDTPLATPEARIASVIGALNRPVPHASPAASVRFEEAVSNTGRAGYHDMVRKAKQAGLEVVMVGDEEA